MISLPAPADFTYELPEEKIAFQPLSVRDRSKLLVYQNGEITDDYFWQLPNYLPAETQMFFNETKVVMARILASLPNKDRAVEVFCLEAPEGKSVEQVMQQKRNAEFYCLIGGARHWKSGEVPLLVNVGKREILLRMEKLDQLEGKFLVAFSWDDEIAFAEILDAAGKVPLPPYIRREVVESDKQRYQTVFAKRQGSVAAPTAGLHFTNEVLGQLAEKGIGMSKLTLHVGGGTFLPLKSDSLMDHKMHSEEMVIDEGVVRDLRRAAALRIAVGTTSLRFLESVYWMGVKALSGDFNWNLEQWDCYNLPQEIPLLEAVDALEKALNHSGGKAYARTSLMIVPGYSFRVCRALITNFHQPQSTLLMLVAAAVGENWKHIYRHALENDYRFLSYGDSSLLFF
ncbi:MAG: S-adenosylmethionine:tRNA ribosyltransferase-isomerase [Cryomorphaceae bacterium]|nr:S-adenosylmethionine:tRNA ribosyltransferase-isomerase [Cryomorphaceae bacterium]